MNKQDRLLYLAGIMDGEGHFCLTDQRNGRGKIYPIRRMIVNQKDSRLTDWLKTYYGGSIHIYKTKGISRWELRGLAVKRLARKLSPYLIVKQEQVERVL